MTLNYPLKFQPILKERIWGGEKLRTQFNKQTALSSVGESWELSDVQGDVSVVSNGELAGKSLAELIEEHSNALLGQKVYEAFGNTFPLLIKIIDAKEPLSIQLHPHDTLAKERHNSFGKTEMWYIMHAEPNAELVVGFKKDSNQTEYLHHLEQKTLMEILNADKVEKGDVYFIPTGRVHAIGAGVLLAEIQQTSDITYRIYDWDRQDAQGNYRELHTELALDAIDYTAQDQYHTDYSEIENISSNVVDCQYFTTNSLPIKGRVSINHSDKDSFVIYICVEGQGQLNGTQIKAGETVLIPACLKSLQFEAPEGAKFLEVYIQ